MCPTEQNPLAWKPVPYPAPTKLQGHFVTLEPLDAERHTESLWQAVRGHDELWTWMPDGPFATQAAFHQSLTAKQSSPAAVFLAIIPHQRFTTNSQPASSFAAPAAAGYASFMRIEPAHGVVEVGNILLSPTLQRTSAATEAMYLMAGYVFDLLGYRRYEWKCNAENAPSRRAALRLGFTFEGTFRQHMVVKDRNRDTAWFAMLDHQWPERRRAFEEWLDPSNFDRFGCQLQSLHASRP